LGAWRAQVWQIEGRILAEKFSAGLSAVVYCLPCGVAASALPAVAFGQATAPSSVTPPSLRPEQDQSSAISIPEVDGLRAPSGAENLTVTPGSVQSENSFSDLDTQVKEITSRLIGKRVSLAQIYAAASAIEEAHVRAGYVLVRVAVPPQHLVDGGPLRIEVIDGFIESIDVSGLPSRVRSAVLARTQSLYKRQHIRLGDIEQPLLIASQFPGLTMSSTLARGSSIGGTRLILTGRQGLLSGAIGGDNNLASSLGTYGVNAQLSINSALGFGEQIYGFAAGGYDLSRFFSANAPARVLGAGVVLPMGNGRFTINPEMTFARTQPEQLVGLPQSRGTLRRLTLRSEYVLKKTRRRSASASVAFEQIDETNKFIGFQNISHDRYSALRLGLTFAANAHDGSAIIASLQLSQGLGQLAALQLKDLPLGTTYSRQGATHEFTKLNAALHAHAFVGSGIYFNLAASGQTSFGLPLFRAEQSSLEGPDAVSGIVGGITASDSAVTVRGELSRPVDLPGIQLAPYAFVAGGVGMIARPTIVEPSEIRAASLGLGLHSALPKYGFSASVEYAHSFYDISGGHQSDRVSFVTSFRF